MNAPPRPAVVLTSIFAPNPVMREIAAQAAVHGFDFIIAGDSKSPAGFFLEGARYLDLAAQRAAGTYGRRCPERTYARKNAAYLEAIRNRATWIVETDDDNFPGTGFWQAPCRNVCGREAKRAGWVNAYRYFSATFVYPRGYPIDRALPDWRDQDPCPDDQPESAGTCPIQQGLADENPDVDAIWRMLHPLPLRFREDRPVILREGCWCPFNSQNTRFFPEVYPLLYLPATCSFRMTDIWRSFIAQRILWTCGWNVSFHAASVVQERNEHSLLRDFEDEISGYLGNQAIIDLLGALDLASGPSNLSINLETCYAAMISAGYFRGGEEELLAAWLGDLSTAL
jgi:hypothetical protein